jgi:hypothetical protein
VYGAATNKINGILQPSDLSGVGEYNIRAAVVSPAINVMCVNMNEAELEPLVYTTFPNAINVDSMGVEKGNDNWINEIPLENDRDFLNRTAVDDIFRWGSQYGRRPPYFQYVSTNPCYEDSLVQQRPTFHETDVP